MFPIAMIGSTQDIVIIAVVVLLLFGGSKLAGFGKSLGQGIKEFKNATHEEDPPAPSTATVASPAAVKTEEK